MIFIVYLLNLSFPINVSIDYSKTVLSREGFVLSSFLSNDDKWRYYYSTAQISSYLKRSIIYKEDKYFYYHFGINPISLFRAFLNNLLSGEIKFGASTITMQTARMLEPKSRNYTNKFIELFRAIQLELNYSKDEIFEIYLNKIPFGGNIEGVGAASVLYFGKNPDKLSLAQAVALSVIPNNPNQLNISKSINPINQKKNNLLAKLSQDKIFPEDMIKDAITEEIVPERLPAPDLALHFSRRAVSEHLGNPIIKTTINYNIQSRIEVILNNYMSGWKNYGINNAAAYLIDNRTNEVIAYVGSNDFWDSNAGQVDGVRAIRSPGSALKPLLYALAVDMGNVTPKLVVLDVPILDPDYSPGNFDGFYRGKVTIEYALSQSLNIPAVNLLKEYGYDKLIDYLVKMNFKTIQQNKNKLGLSMILGGCGVSLEEMTEMYSIFANNGQFKKAKYIAHNDSVAKQIISPESAYIISEILTKPQRPDLPSTYRSAKGVPIIAWKTGTSQGRRDGWAIGYNSAYTLGVWTGNFSGKPNSYISGANIAVPLLFDIFHSLSGDEKRTWLTKPSGLDNRLVDANTGLLPNELSQNVVSDYYIPGVSISKQTDHLVKIWVSKDEKISYCSECLPESSVKQKIYELYPLELQLYYKSQSFAIVSVPPHNPNCRVQKNGIAPLILSPKGHSEYFIELGSDEGIALKAGLDDDSRKSYWFVNGKFVGSAQKNSSINWLPQEPGKYIVSCTDEKGRSSEINVVIKTY